MESVQQVDEEEYEEKVKRPVVKVLCVLNTPLRVGAVCVVRTDMVRYVQACGELNQKVGT